MVVSSFLMQASLSSSNPNCFFFPLYKPLWLSQADEFINKKLAFNLSTLYAKTLIIHLSIFFSLSQKTRDKLQLFLFSSLHSYTQLPYVKEYSIFHLQMLKTTPVSTIHWFWFYLLLPNILFIIFTLN